MKENNYYWILGLSPDTATLDDIKANFRKLAKRWHPDVNHGSKEAEEMMLKLQEAYSTLSDPVKKAEYDKKFNFEDANLGFETPFVQTVIHNVRDSVNPIKEKDGSDVSFTVEVSFKDALWGCKHWNVTYNRECDCPRCHGYASSLGRSGVSLCQRCAGLGKITKPAQNGVLGSLVTETCPDCAGKSFIVKDPCSICNGLGRIIVPTDVDLEIPAGVNNGTILRVVGMGHMGHLNKWNGDFYANIKVVNDTIYHREGSNLFLKLKVPVETLILGGEVEIPLPLGGSQKENIPPLRPGHWSFAIAGHGMPIIGKKGKRGNLVVSLEAEFPDILNDEEKCILESYAKKRKETRSGGSGDNKDGSE